MIPVWVVVSSLRGYSKDEEHCLTYTEASLALDVCRRFALDGVECWVEPRQVGAVYLIRGMSEVSGEWIKSIHLDIGEAHNQLTDLMMNERYGSRWFLDTLRAQS